MASIRAYAQSIVQGITEALRYPTHFTYLCLLLFGIIANFRLLQSFIQEYGGAEPRYFQLLNVTLGFFVSASFVHLWLIYRSLIDAENPHSELSQKYVGWINTPCEVALRLLAGVFLFGVAGKFVAVETLPMTWIWAALNCGVFVCFVVWSVVARWKSTNPDVRADKLYKSPFIGSDALALAHWLFVLLAMVTNNPTFLSLMVIAAVLYLAVVVIYRVPGDGRKFLLVLFAIGSATYLFFDAGITASGLHCVDRNSIPPSHLVSPCSDT